ncbi:nucleotidyltransferase [Caldicellulosiruptor changbaiensis]|uniref:tRNA(Met) cytidine acetate ligase n=1 Tax=Caldicellulosiruptor changbaiensis TaxID=1222016 RepID=A0A3T0D8Z3_9FIRM|nr:nucleotidyltransferase [Caldicellulosiruptor changbaiensis]AZT91651.1 nucleotidyltransferase [Caldicellulosiruptor changbaiensis]
MKVAGIVVEYNPFHNGHLYHLQKTKEITGADVVVAVMSGNFIQRGEPAIVNKWARTKMALLNGVDVVFELPFAYACNSAEVFAYGAISILNSLGVDWLVFGSEAGDISLLKKIAMHLAFEEDEFKKYLKIYLKEGHSFPKARELALKRVSKEDIEFLPNNILGVEYIKWILRTNSKIEPLTIKRVGSLYNDPNLGSGSFCSATAIRQNINNLELIKDKMPPFSYQVLMEEIESGRGPVSLNDFFEFFLYRAIVYKDFLKEQFDVKEGLENRFYKHIFSSSSLEDLLSKVKTKRYTLTRLQRIFIHCLVDSKVNQKTLLSTKPYIRVLGFNSRGKGYLNSIKEKLKYITKLDSYIMKNPEYNSLLELEIRASQIHALKYKEFHKYLQLEFKQHPIYIPSRE